MARVSDNNGHGWDFIEIGKEYQYKEDWYIAMVRIIADNSDDEMYRFKVKAMEANSDALREWEVSASKGQKGTYNGALQFFPEGHLEYIPLGSSWPFNFRE